MEGAEEGGGEGEGERVGEGEQEGGGAGRGERGRWRVRLAFPLTHASSIFRVFTLHGDVRGGSAWRGGVVWMAVFDVQVRGTGTYPALYIYVYATSIRFYVIAYFMLCRVS